MRLSIDPGLTRNCPGRFRGPCIDRAPVVALTELSLSTGSNWQFRNLATGTAWGY